MMRSLLSSSPSTTRHRSAISHCFFCQTASRVIPAHQAGVFHPKQGASIDSPSESLISVGNQHAWLCSACECWNGKDAWDHPERYQNGSSSSSSASAFAYSPSPVPSTNVHSGPGSASTSSPFCKTCQRNQALLLGLLSNYLPNSVSDLSNTTAEEKRLLEGLPAYKAQLEQRYPPLCEACAPVVQERILEADRVARRYLLAGWLEQGDRAPNFAGRSGHSYRHGGENSGEIEPQAPYSNQPAQRALWLLQASLWTLSQTTSLTISLYEALTHSNSPRNVPISLSILLDEFTSPWRRQYRQFYIVFQLVSLFWSAWDPLHVAVVDEYARTRRVPVVKGRRYWQASQHVAYAVRMLNLALQSDAFMAGLMAFLHFVTTFVMEFSRLRSGSSEGAGNPAWEESYEHESPPSSTYTPSNIRLHDGTREKLAFSLSLASLCITLAAHAILRIEKPPRIRLVSKRWKPREVARIRGRVREGIASGASFVTDEKYTSNRHVPEQHTRSAASFSTWNTAPAAQQSHSSAKKDLPVFGETSLPQAQRSSGKGGVRSSIRLSSDDEEEDTSYSAENAENDERQYAQGEEVAEDSMDWQATPTAASDPHSGLGAFSTAATSRRDDGYIRTQKFCPPTPPTGLEELFNKALDIAAEESEAKQNEQRGGFARIVPHGLADLLYRTAFTLVLLVLPLGVGWCIHVLWSSSHD